MEVCVPEPDQPAGDASLIVEQEEHVETRFAKKHRNVLTKLNLNFFKRNDEQVKNCETENELSNDEWDSAYKIAAARRGVSGRLNDVVERLLARTKPCRRRIVSDSD